MVHPEYLFHLIPVRRTPYTRNVHNLFSKSSFPGYISKWNKLDPSLRNSESFHTFKKNILQFIRPTANSVYHCHNPKKIKLITRLRLGLSHLREHKFKHNFQEPLNPLCNCGHGIQSATYFFLHCPLFTNERYTLLRTLSSIDCNLLNNTYLVLTQTLLFGNLSFNSNKNLEILNATIDYILSTKRFGKLLFSMILSSY